MESLPPIVVKSQYKSNNNFQFIFIHCPASDIYQLTMSFMAIAGFRVVQESQEHPISQLHSPAFPGRFRLIYGRPSSYEASPMTTNGLSASPDPAGPLWDASNQEIDSREIAERPSVCVWDMVPAMRPFTYVRR
ncbi:MAG: hypothetical protein N2C14_00590, partial [Planctomycetales bacterium]